MGINFCKKCGVPLELKKRGVDRVFRCKKCDSVNQAKGHVISNEKVQHEKERGTGVKKDENIFATYHHNCKKCGYDKVQVLDLGVFISDEDNLILLQCGRCGYSERIGRKTS
ncbi:MAG: hypothetical protein KKF68_03570 [Nanoarchaeota archaeon]|nr:hypothetical protein [Nanoarchaeota archaeon]